eukprot:7577351-Prorocentrum_lima.AAC.1
MGRGAGLHIRTMFPHPVGVVMAGEPAVGIHANEDSWEQERPQLSKEGNIIFFWGSFHGSVGRDDTEAPGGERQ